MLHLKLQKLLEDRNLIIDDVYKLCDGKIKRSSLYCIFDGTVKRPNYEHIFAIKKALRLPDEFFFENDSNQLEQAANV